ncbi:putative reverse transcriptase domain protein [Favolaschia claudopus]|uniref:Reverse transcriptase domain protein n=1 Tax=Favolaschia claudopus TaxID=2862362 RepID=A0AAW0A4N2_9AGAR
MLDNSRTGNPTIRSIISRVLQQTSKKPTIFAGGIQKPKSAKLRNAKQAKERIDYAIQHAWADSTLEKYASSLKAFHTFCDSEGVDQAQRLPASEFLLCSFSASRAGEIAGGTARAAVAAVKAWHIIEGEDWQGGIRLRYVLRGVENLAPESSKRDIRPPVTASMVDLLAEHLDKSSPLDTAVLAAASSALWGQIRLGEILSDTQGKFKAGRIPMVADLRPPSTSAGSRALHLPWTKTKGKRGEDAMLVKQNTPSDPISALESHLTTNSIPSNLPLFSYRNAQNSLICLTRKRFLQRCNEIWGRYGYPAFTGHSFRIGGTTELLLAGVHPDVVQAMGRWQSEAFKIYWRRLDLLAPLHWEFKAV